MKYLERKYAHFFHCLINQHTVWLGQEIEVCHASVNEQLSENRKCPIREQTFDTMKSFFVQAL